MQHHASHFNCLSFTGRTAKLKLRGVLCSANLTVHKGHIIGKIFFKKMYEDSAKEFRDSFQWFRPSFFQWEILSKPAHTSSLYFHVQETFHKIWIYFLFNSFSVYCLLYKHLFLSNFAYLKIKIIFTESTILKWIISEWVAGRQKMRF